MSPEQNSPNPEIAPPKSQGGNLALSVCYLLLAVFSFWKHPSSLFRAGLIVDIGITVFCVFQFGARTFEPMRTAARTANIAASTRSLLKAVNRIIQTFGVVVMVVVCVVAVANHFNNFLILWWPPMILLPQAISDLIGEPRFPERGTFAPRINWSDLKPIHSDHWGTKA
jgi:hypothetical protein